MSNTAIVAISRNGARLGRLIASAMAPDATLYLDRRFIIPGDRALPFDLPARPVVQQAFQDYESLILLMPVGAAIRLLAPRLADKHLDAGVVCIDDAGTFAVSLLSGHVGGADRLAERVASIIGATPVITSASHTAGTIAVDLLGQDMGWRIEADSTTVTRASAAVVNGDQVGVYQDAGERDWWPSGQPLPDNIVLFGSLDDLASSTRAASLVITDRLRPGDGSGPGFPEFLSGKAAVVYRPRSLVIGMGCRRGVPLEELEALLDETLRQNNLSRESVSCIATADLKRDEVGILLLAERLGVEVQCYSAEELNSVFDADESGLPGQAAPGADAGAFIRPTPSPVAHRLIGVWGVSEPGALLASGARGLLVTRQKTQRATIAIARTELA